MKGCVRSVIVLAALAGTSHADAAILWDYSPDATAAGITEDYIGPFFNRADLQYFAETVRFDEAVQLSGMDIYEPTNMEGPKASAVTIRIWPDEAGSPGLDVLEFQAAITTVDSDGTATLAGFQRVHATFTTSVNLAANTSYWVGMSGFGDPLGQLTLNKNAPGDSRIFVFDAPNRLALLTGTHVGDMAFRLHGAATVPMPGSVGLFGGALITLLIARRRRRDLAGLPVGGDG